MKNFLNHLLLPLMIMSFISCGTEKSENASEIPENTDDEMGETPSINFENSEVMAYPDAIIEMYNPLGNENFKEGNVPFEFNVKNYPFTEAPRGFMLRMIVNGDDAVSYHMPIFQREFKTGTYRAVAYLIDQKGIALKEFGNYVDRDFTVGDSKPFPESDEPYMVINLPENEHIFSSGEEVIIDFLLIGGALKEDKLKFIVSVNGEDHEMKELAPLKISNLSPGDHEISVKLVRENGEELAGIFSSGKRKITVQ